MSGAVVTGGEAPLLTASDVTLGGETVSVTLAIADAAVDSADTLGSLTITGIESGWSLSGDGATAIAEGAWTAEPTDLNELVLVAPLAEEPETVTLSVTADETAVDASGVVTATASTSFVVSVSAIATTAAAETPMSTGGGGERASAATPSGAADPGGTTVSAITGNTATVTAGALASGGAVAGGTAGAAATSVGGSGNGALTLTQITTIGDSGDLFTLAPLPGSGQAGWTQSGPISGFALIVPAEVPLDPTPTAVTYYGLLEVVEPGVDGTDTTVTLVLSSSGGATPTIGPAIDPTVDITGSPVEGSTLTASVVTSGFAGTAELHWQRFYSGGWFNIPVELSPYSAGEVLNYVTSPTYVVREEDEAVQGIRVEVAFVDTTGATVATMDSPSVGPVLAAPASLSLSSITGTALPGDTLSVSGLVSSQDFVGAPIFNWQRFYSGSWFDIPIELSPYSAGEALTYVTTPSYVVRAEDEDVLGIRVEASYINNTGQTITLDSAPLTISEAPVLTAPDVTLPENAASVALAITDTTFDTEYSLANVTIGGVPAGWSLSGDGAVNVGAGSWTAAPGGLAGLVLVAPPFDEQTVFALSVTASETALGPTGPLTATATTSFAVTVSAVAEAPVFSATTAWTGSEGGSITLSGLAATGDSDDALSATLTGLAPGWTLVDTASGLSFTAATITAIPVTDLGSLVILAPVSTSLVISDVLSLTVSSSELGAATTASASELLSVFATGNLSGANLAGANLANADLASANLSGANLTGTILTNANLTGANLSLTNSGTANLRGADLTNADLSGANLSGADLSNANLTDANLAGVNLTGTTLTGAILTGTNLPLQLSSLAASSSGSDVTGDVIDGFTGSVAINAFDDTTNKELGSVTISYSVANQNEGWSIGNLTFAVGDTIAVTVEDSESAFYTVTGAVIAATPAGVAGSAINLALTDPAADISVAVTIAGIPQGWSLNGGTDLANGTWTVETKDPSTLSISPASGVAGAAVLAATESWTNAAGGNGSEFITDNVEAYAAGAPIFALSGDDTLTGSGGNDLFVFAQPIGNDRIYDFNPASDRLDLIGFSGVSSFTDLQGKLVDDANGNGVLTLGTGETITFVGVAAASLAASNFLFNEVPTTNNVGTMTIADGAVIPLGGTVANTGTIALDSIGERTRLVILEDGVTLQGGGAVTLSDSAGNTVAGSGTGATLANLDNTISGAGTLGGSLALSNSGVIDATGINPLTIDTGGNIIANAGTIEATGAGGLVIKSAVANSGTLAADGGNLTVEGAVSGDGVAVISGTGTLEFAAGSAENTSFAIGAAGTLKLDPSTSFNGTVSGFAAGDAIDLADLAFASDIILSYADNGTGGGTLTVDNGTHTVDLALLGQYAAAGFQAQSDPGGGTLITYSPQTSASEATSLTNPSHS